MQIVSSKKNERGFVPKEEVKKLLKKIYIRGREMNIGVIGLGFGAVNIRKMLEGTPWVRCHALCDVDAIRLDKYAGELKKDFPIQASEILLYKDFRKLLENKDIDGVIIATPDHWHTYIYAEASKAGKAIYIEKPTGHSIQDCHLTIDLQKKYQNVVTPVYGTSVSIILLMHLKF